MALGTVIEKETIIVSNGIKTVTISTNGTILLNNVDISQIFVAKSSITNELSVPFVTVVPTNSAFLLARFNESQVLTQLVSWAEYSVGATATVYVLPTFQTAFTAATSTNDILVNTAWNTNNLSVQIPAGGGLAMAFTNGYLNVTNAIIFIRAIIP